ncbi:MAG: methionine--tRNA ligase [Candidatus Cloacimonetes bacterium]|nr:methionine--tRNA ligase [Candidatus Cloacimonadota bacterium]
MAIEKYLVTSALPYANGDLHIGHLAGAYLPADIFVRFQKLLGNDVIYICGTDEHGTPISIKADQKKVPPRKIVDKYHRRIKSVFAGLNFCFDNFSGTARPVHYKISRQFFTNLYKNGYITTHTNKQLYCPHCKRFLPDRYVEGECPFCHSKEARGDQCDACGKLIDAIQLINPVCITCGHNPIIKETTNWFLNLPKFSDKLKKWIESKTEWKDNVKKFILGWLKSGLKERAITRDLDWGVPVPIENAKGKVIYVWFEAPIGYISSTIEWAERIGQPEKWKDYWFDKDRKLIHFIGKDNIPFHTIIWPAVLMGQDEDYILPYDVPANEFLNLEGRRISTSRNWAVWVNEYLEDFSADPLRYYLAANAPENKDCDFVWKEFQEKYNTDLANILGNFVNRVLKFSDKNFNHEIPFPTKLSAKNKEILEDISSVRDNVKQFYKTFKVRKACKSIIDLARFGNQYFDKTSPWTTIKSNPDTTAEAIYICGEIIRNLAIMIYPIIPSSAERLWNMLNFDKSILEYGWDGLLVEQNNPIKIGKIETLFEKIPDDIIEKQIQKLKGNNIMTKEESKETIDFETFKKLDLRIAEIISAEKVKNADKLLKLKIAVGDNIKQIIAGIAKHYAVEDLIGKKILIVNNLKPTIIKGEKSEAMLLAAVDGEKLTLLIPDKDIPEGSKVL